MSSAKSEDDEFVTALPDVSFMPIPFYAPEGTGAQAGVLESFPKEVIVELPSKDEGKPFDPLDVLGLTREAPIPPSPLLDTPILGEPRTIVRVSFLDAPLTLGKGKKKQVVHAGAGMLFPELMGTA